MHYPRDAFSTNGLPTITTKQANVVIGQREKLSPTDIAEIRQYYKCWEVIFNKIIENLWWKINLFSEIGLTELMIFFQVSISDKK